MTDELTDLLGENTTDESNEVEAPEKGNNEQADESEKVLANKRDELLAEVKQLRAERRQLKEVPKETATETVNESITTPADNTAESWAKFIKSSSGEAVKPVLTELEKIKTVSLSKAYKAFVKKHPEYANDPDGDKRDAMLAAYARIKTRPELDADEVFEDLEDAWAIRHRSEIVDKERKMRDVRNQSEAAAAEIAASSSAGTADKKPQAVTGATAADYKTAKIAGMDIEKFMKLKQQAEETWGEM